MRRLALALTVLSIAAGPVLARTSARPDSCTRDGDRTAFDTEGLKSELMVTALACRQQDKYNEFMHTYQPTIAAEEKDLNAYFKRVYGRQYQKAHDDYISNLANVQEQDGLKAGTAFCDAFTSLFDEVMSLHDSTELADFARSKALVQPVAFNTCAAEPVRSASRHRSSHHKT